MKHTVLVVEDEDDLREVMRDALELNGYTVVVARDGQEALEQLDQINKICVVLLDLVMPRMNGWDFFVTLRQRAAFIDVPVIVHCSSPTHAPSGVTRVLVKPLEFDQLLAVVHEYCAAQNVRPS
jgi:CheY-like chemotaxis protein